MMELNSRYRRAVSERLLFFSLFFLAALFCQPYSALSDPLVEAGSATDGNWDEGGKQPACPSLSAMICICISEMITKNTSEEARNYQFVEDATRVLSAVACRQKEWGRIGQVACNKGLCNEVQGGKPRKSWPANSKRNLENCITAARAAQASCEAGTLDCRYKHWYHQQDIDYQPPDGDSDPYNNDPDWCPKDLLNNPGTIKHTYPNYGKPDPVHLIMPPGVKGKDKKGPFDEGGSCAGTIIISQM